MLNRPTIVRQTIVYSDGTMVIYKLDPEWKVSALNIGNKRAIGKCLYAMIE